jgi:hypothetical protein
VPGKPALLELALVLALLSKFPNFQYAAVPTTEAVRTFHPFCPEESTVPEVNHLAVLIAAVASFALGGLWYSPALFGRVWQREAGVSDEQMKNANMLLIFGLALVLCWIASFVFALFLGPRPPLALGLGAGSSAGLCWVTASFGINYLFERKSLKLFLINGGYHTLQYTLIGLVLGLWH